MKFELMTPHVETHGVYRIRRMPGEDKGYYFEFHKKSVYENGELFSIIKLHERCKNGEMFCYIISAIIVFIFLLKY